MIKYTTSTGALYCLICKQMFDNPYITECGHTFCHQCITTHINTTPYCPLCKAPVTHHDMLPDTLIRASIGEQIVSCSHHKCKWEGTMTEYKCHLVECPMVGELAEWLGGFSKSKHSVCSKSQVHHGHHMRYIGNKKCKE